MLKECRSSLDWLRAKTARAIAVVLAGPVSSPRVVRRVEMVLCDPAMPATSGPYHEVMDLPWEQATVSVRKSAKRIEAIASKALARLIDDAQDQGFAVHASECWSRARNLRKDRKHSQKSAQPLKGLFARYGVAAATNNGPLTFHNGAWRNRSRN